jgi:tetratricopeptide (TPR) repeat protein
MLAGAWAVLDRLDDFDEARGLELVFDRLNQWSLAGGAAAVLDGWEADPLVGTLPEDLRGHADATVLAAPTFTVDGDVRHLRDQRWLADIARVARAGAIDDLDVAVNLFRWTVRSLALVGDPPMVPTVANPGSRWLFPGEILLAGRASPPQRAWIFLELLRHAGLEGVMLATGAAEAGTLRPWVPAVVSGGELFLFEPGYGMPIPGPDGLGVATLRQAADTPAILAAMSLPDRAYPVQAAALAEVTVLAVADPWSLSHRMARLDPLARAAREMRVATNATAVAASAATNAGTGRSPQLWEFPWRTVAARRDSGGTLPEAARGEFAVLQLPFVPRESADPRRERIPARPLLAGRLREFRGDFDGPEGAKAAYLAARPSRAALATALRQVPPEQADRLRGLYGQMKEDASYWLGVLMLAEGEYAAAVDYLERMILTNAPDSRWLDAARANLAQAFLGLGRTAEAVAVLRADLSPQRFGSRLLADRLAADAAADRKSAEAPAP